MKIDYDQASGGKVAGIGMLMSGTHGQLHRGGLSTKAA